ncbi:hypothetical protein BB558_001839 [Smittium angustum]|uniref:Amino acid permease/ SLC12A domain-containing protein n=1 Tax=Smittium angustum TaxID=133377 RepID=A0A2U1JAI0_SMIAN|nr:hypothetical protein BB558_001839 [Smittium angustum]
MNTNISQALHFLSTPNQKNDEVSNSTNVRESDVHVTHLKRSLKSRHMSMIAIGGTIGTGLFVGSGSALYMSGPAGSLTAYFIIGTMIYFIISSLGEMCSYIPVSDPLSYFSSTFIDPALGFAFGWNYWFSWMVTISAELVTTGIVMKFWFPKVNQTIWSFLAWFIIVSVNSFSVRGFGEVEFYLSFFKICAVLVFIVIGIFTIAGVTGGTKIGFSNWQNNESPFFNGIAGITSSCITAAFSFQGTEIIGITVGESENPKRDVPRAIRSVFFRIMLFYILTIFIIGLAIPRTNSNLINASTSNISISPFTIVFQLSGIKWAPHLINAVVLIAIISAGNSGLYACTRVLWVLATQGKAPRLLRKTTKHSVPFYALLSTALFSALFVIILADGTSKAYNILIDIAGVTGFIFWMGILLSHLRFRKAFVAQGKPLDNLPYKSFLYPFGQYYSIFLLTFIIIGQGYDIIYPKFLVVPFISKYVPIILFFVLWLSYRLVKKTKFVDPFEADLYKNSIETIEMRSI